MKLFILNNRYMGMVRQWQELLHGSRYSESYSESLPDFVKLADAFQAIGLRATTLGELDDVIRRMLAHEGAVIADICVDETENCYPMIPSGAAHNEMILGPEHSDPRGQDHRRRPDAWSKAHVRGCAERRSDASVCACRRSRPGGRCAPVLDGHAGRAAGAALSSGTPHPRTARRDGLL